MAARALGHTNQKRKKMRRRQINDVGFASPEPQVRVRNGTEPSAVARPGSCRESNALRVETSLWRGKSHTSHAIATRHAVQAKPISRLKFASAAALGSISSTPVETPARGRGSGGLGHVRGLNIHKKSGEKTTNKAPYELKPPNTRPMKVVNLQLRTSVRAETLSKIKSGTWCVLPPKRPRNAKNATKI